MNDLLQKHGCANVFHMPEGLRELMGDISREVLRAQPKQLLGFITNYLSVLLITREHGIMTVKILDDLCDCRPSLLDHLLEIGLDKDQAKDLSHVIHKEISSVEPGDGKEKVREIQIMKKILVKHPLDEEFSSKVIQVIRNAYRDYWYRKKVMAQAMKMRSDEPWQIAANNTLELYKRTKPSMAELTRATQRIQAAYRGYHVRRKLLDHLKKPEEPEPTPKPKRKKGPRVGIGLPVDIAASRDIDLGPVLNIKVKEDDMEKMFEKKTPKPSVQYSGPQTPSLMLDEEDDASHRQTLDIMSTRTDDNQTLSHYGVNVDNASKSDDYYGQGGSAPRISFASKPLMLGTSETSENKDEVEIPESIVVDRPESPASTVPSSAPAGDISDLDDAIPDDNVKFVPVEVMPLDQLVELGPQKTAQAYDSEQEDAKGDSVVEIEENLASNVIDVENFDGKEPTAIDPVSNAAEDLPQPIETNIPPDEEVIENSGRAGDDDGNEADDED